MTTFVMFNDYKKGITIEVPNYRPRFGCNQYDYKQIKFEFIFKLGDDHRTWYACDFGGMS